MRWRHLKVPEISFTSGTTTGRHLAHVAAEKLIGIAGAGRKIADYHCWRMRISGRPARICCGIFSSAGQACIASSGCLSESLYARFDGCWRLTRALRVGHPFTDGVHVGPLINEKHRQSVQAYVELAKREGPRAVRWKIGRPTLASGASSCQRLSS